MAKKHEAPAIQNAPANGNAQTAEQPQAPVQTPRTMAEINAAFDALSPADRERLKALQVPAHTLAGTTGLYRTKDGKGTTNDRKLAKLNVKGKPIPAYTQARPAVTVNGVAVSATHADETEQLRGRYRQGWGVQVIEACKKRAETLKRKLTPVERDKVLVGLGDTVPAAWRPRYNKDGVTPALQYARHIQVMTEFGIDTAK